MAVTLNSHNQTTVADYAFAWHEERYAKSALWLGRSLWANAILSVITIGIVIALLIILPLKQVQTVLLIENKQSGEITVMGKVEPLVKTKDWPLTRYLLTHYIINRESYNSDNLVLPYQTVWAMSTSSIAHVYHKEVSSDNKQSPLNVYGKERYITVNVLSVNVLNEHTALIRFDKTLHNRATEETSRISEQAIVKWTFENKKETLQSLLRNPLQFKVSFYQVTQVQPEQKENPS